MPKNLKFNMMKTLIIPIKIFLLLTILTGFIYPLIITGLAQLLFPFKANGSLIIQDNKVVGSKLIGQQFVSAKYFHSRPSATEYSPMPSEGSNLCLTNNQLKCQYIKRKNEFISENSLTDSLNLPAEMFFNSASGLDPHISYKSAILQINRISKVRNFNTAQKTQLIHLVKKFTEAPQFLCLGDERVNVLLLNLELEKIR
jgi:potassium-transporting ATPase KdpC subunit